MSTITIPEALELVRLGFTHAEIEAYATSSASAPVKAAKAPAAKASPKGKKAKANTFYQNVIVAKAPDRAARKALAAEMRAEGIEPRGEAWEQRKAAAGLK